MNETSGFCAFPEWRTLRVSGPDAASWLNGIVTCNVMAVQPGRGIWGALLTKQGKISAELQIIGGSDELFIGVSGGEADEVLQVLDGYLVMEDAEIRGSELAWLVTSLMEPLPSQKEGALAMGRLAWGQREVVALVGEKAVLAAIAQAAAVPCFTEAQWSRWLTDEAVPRFGFDYDTGDNPHAASLERRVVDWSKGCYLGQEVVCMQDMRGKVRRCLVSLSTRAAVLPQPGEEIYNEEGKLVGEITSTGSQRLMGKVRAPEFELGTRLHVGTAELVVEPLV